MSISGAISLPQANRNQLTTVLVSVVRRDWQVTYHQHNIKVFKEGFIKVDDTTLNTICQYETLVPRQ